MGNKSQVKKEWNAVISEKLKDGLTIDDLKHEYPFGIEMEPNVVASDLEGYDHTVGTDKAWINMASIRGGNSLDKNTLALQSLQHGANGLSIELSKVDSIADILKDVLTSYLDVRIDCKQLTVQEVEIQKSLLNNEDFPNIRWVNQGEDYDQFHVSSENRINEIKNIVDVIGKSTRTDIVVTVSKNLLFEIATLRAIRALVDELNIDSYNIIVDYEVEGTNELGDYNLIEKTYKIMSGVLGGADAILTPYHGDEDSRLTLNIHNVLDLESGMKNVLDPLKGSYYIEKLTGEIIQKVKDFDPLKELL